MSDAGSGQPIDEAAAKGPSYTQELAEVNAKLDAIMAALHVTVTTPLPPAPTPTPAPPAPPAPTPVPAPPAPPVPQPIQAVYWVNQSQGDLHLADAAHIVTALNLQAAHLCELWPSVKPVAHTLWTGDPAKIPAEAWPMYWLPDADTAGALGYHDVDPHGRPYGRVFTRYNGRPWPALQPTRDGVTISNISSHEAVEIQADPSCVLVATAPNGDVWALEDADPVESFVYDIMCPDGARVSVSDFVTGAFFGHGPGPLDAMGKASKPFTIASGGYAIINDKQVFADKPSLRYLSQQGTPAARSARRLGRVLEPQPDPS
jgi:hypothetical protein